MWPRRCQIPSSPIFLLDRDLSPYPTRSDYDLVGVDNFVAGYELAKDLIKLGRRRLARLARPHSAHTVDARFAGVREAGLASPGVTVNPPAYKLVVRESCGANLAKANR